MIETETFWNPRCGMIRSVRVAKLLKRFMNHGRFSILVEVRELCRKNDGEMYEAPYNLAIEVGGDYDDVASTLVDGDFVALGYYTQSYEEKVDGEPTGEYITKLKLRGIQRIRPEHVAEAQQRVFDSVRIVNLVDIS